MIDMFGLRMDGEGMILFLLMMGASFCLGMACMALICYKDDNPKGDKDGNDERNRHQ